MVEFAKDFHAALAHAPAAEIAEFFTEDAYFVNPLDPPGASQLPKLTSDHSDKRAASDRETAACDGGHAAGLPELEAHRYRRGAGWRRLRMEGRRQWLWKDRY